MRTIRFGKSFLLLLSTMVFMGTLPATAQEAKAEESATAEEPANSTLTQGQAAVILARRMGLFSESGETPTAARAMQLLSARGISPKAGWEADALLDAGQLARMLVQALGLESELTDDQIAGEDATPYIDLLIEKYDLDVTTLNTAADLNATRTDDMRGSNTSASSTDPLRYPVNPNASEGQDVIPIRLVDLERALAAVVGAPGSDSGQVNRRTNNMTPSAP